jgi:hypothetical protein
MREAEGYTMILRIVKALLLGIAATSAVLALASPSVNFAIVEAQVWLALCVGALVALAVALPN